MRKTRNADRLRAVFALAAIVATTAFVPTTHAQEVCEIPLFVKQNSMGANVMFLADNSGSMNSAVYHAGYDLHTTYTGPFKSNATYFVAKAGLKEPNDFDPALEAFPSAPLVVSDTGKAGRYLGNYLNWIYYHATDQQRATLPQVTRIQVLKSVLVTVLYRSARLDVGLTVFQYDHGGSVIGKCGVNPKSLEAQIEGIAAVAWTPLGEAAETVLDYFSYDGPDAAIKSPCQYNFLIVVTDGLPTMDTEVSAYLHDTDGDGNDPGNCASIGSPEPETSNCSDYFDDVTYYMAHEDLRPDLDGPQNVLTYVVGYHEDGQLLRDAAANGDGLFFYAESAAELILSIEYALQDILRRISAGSAVAVVSTEKGVDDRLYRGKFMPIDWDGYLECYQLPYQDGASALWEAGELIRTSNLANRKIFTALGSDVFGFTTGSASKLREAMNVATDLEAANLINWGRGHNVLGYRDRHGWILGDIVHSTPVVVGPPAEFHMSPEYQNFMDAHEQRRKMVYVGANDGMLHAIDAASGREVWAFVPEFALPKFDVMADSGYCHTYTCDQTVSVADMRLRGSWRTVLSSNGREGGASVFALDITEPESPDVLWQNEVPNGKSFLSEVEMASIGGRSVAMVGSGLDRDEGVTWLYVYDLGTGDLLGERKLSDIDGRNKATRPATVDVNLDGEVDLVYIADMSGDVWRFETRGDSNPSNWEMTKFFDGFEPITANPVTSYGTSPEIWVYFGTGVYFDDEDMITSNQQYFYAIRDVHDGGTATRRTLADQTGAAVDIGSSRGWWVELWGDVGERVTEQAVVVAENVIFTSFAPSTDACVAGGESWLYQMAYDTGRNPQSESDNENDVRQTGLGEGIASYPVVDLSQGKIVVQGSDASIKVEPIQADITRLVVKSWQETYDNVPAVPQAQ